MKRLFVTGVPVIGEELIGREEELKEIKHLLQTGQSVILIAPRRFGKTSLVLTLLKQLKKEGHYVADVDLFDIIDRRGLAERITESTLENKRIYGFITKLKEGAKDLFKGIEVRETIENFEFVLSFGQPKADISTLLREAFDLPEELAQRDNKDLFFFYDEFGDIKKFDGEEVLKLARSKFQRHRRVSYVFAGSYESVMKEIFADGKSAFYKFGRIVYLAEIAREDFTKYIDSKFQEEGISISGKIINQLLERTRCHPYYTQLLCQHIYYLVKGEKTVVVENDLLTGFENAFISERTYLEKVWEEMSGAPAQLTLLIKIARREGNLYALEHQNGINVSRCLTSLIKRGIIRRSNDTYQIIDPFFEYYLAKK
ncbi:ATP-binding protein [bacterium]|nr:ATP-binding protein [bacterium]MBU1615877.1 ATP-binding protein [bacterium]